MAILLEEIIGQIIKEKMKNGVPIEINQAQME